MSNTEKIYTPFMSGTITNDIKYISLPSNDIFSSKDIIKETVNNKEYIAWGDDNLAPYTIKTQIASDEVLSQAMFFNILTTFGIGAIYKNRDGSQIEDHEIRRWLMTQNMGKLSMEQATDIKHFFFCVTLLYISRDKTRITKIRHIDASNVRFAPADKNGQVPYILYADFNDDPNEVLKYPLLDETDPLTDLMIKTGREKDLINNKNAETQDFVFAMVSKIPTVGNPYYPTPYYLSVITSKWLEIKKNIPVAKLAKIKNTTSIKYLVSINQNYWKRLYDESGIMGDFQKQKDLVRQKKQEIENFCSGIENSGKMWLTQFYVDPNGNKVEDIIIDKIDTSKPGGDFSEEIIESTNIICFAMGVHPNMVGASPGKAQMNNSGSDKRELFTLKQATEIPFRMFMQQVHEVAIWFNGWENKIKVDYPMVQLTTLDEHTDSKTVTPKE